MKILIVDDDPSRHELFNEWFPDAVHAFSYDEAVIQILEGNYEYLFLDHDLGWDSKNGVDIANFIANEFVTPRATIIHSWNPSGAQEMRRILEKRGLKVFVTPFGKDLRQFIEWNRKELVCRT